MSEASHHRRIITATRAIWLLCFAAILVTLGVIFETSRRVRIAEQTAIQQLKLVGEVRSKTESWLPSWLPFSELDAFQRVVELSLVGERFDDANLVHLKQLQNLRTFRLAPVNAQRCKITDRGMANLVVTNQLESFDISGVQIGDATLAHVAKSSRIRSIRMACTAVSDQGVVHLPGCLLLSEVCLMDCPITDKAIPVLAQLHPDTRFDLRFTAANRLGSRRLRCVLRPG